MTAEHSLRPLPVGIDTEIAIVGGGLSGTLAATLLGRSGYQYSIRMTRMLEFFQESTPCEAMA